MSIRQGTRIALIGAGGVGKTTSRDHIAKELDIPTFNSVSRIIYNERELSEMTVQNTFTAPMKLELQTQIFEAKVAQDREYTYVMDRSILDHYAYCLAYCGSELENEQYLEFEERVRSLMLSTYSHIFYFPWGYFDVESDGVRQDKQAWQSMIDAIMVGYLHRWQVPAIEVPQTQGPEFRNQFIMNHILGTKPLEPR
jgi:ABC-type glutathione transport system ATPase component